MPSLISIESDSIHQGCGLATENVKAPHLILMGATVENHCSRALVVTHWISEAKFLHILHGGLCSELVAHHGDWSRKSTCAQAHGQGFVG